MSLRSPHDHVEINLFVALEAFVAAFEGAHGEITAEEIESATRRASSRAIVVRSVAPQLVPGRRRQRGVR